MPCTNFMGMLNSEWLLECHHIIINTSKEIGKLVGSDRNSEGDGIRTWLHESKARIGLDNKTREKELWRELLEAKIEIEIEISQGTRCDCSLGEYIIYLKTKESWHISILSTNGRHLWLQVLVMTWKKWICELWKDLMLLLLYCNYLFGLLIVKSSGGYLELFQWKALWKWGQDNLISIPQTPFAFWVLGTSYSLLVLPSEVE